eukprot:m.220488 g.220488  ORF g.220488 m.220488 type:complete len:57 (-) comp15116_c1_seq65:423-593(-)
MFYLLKKKGLARVSAEAELAGLDGFEHGQSAYIGVESKRLSLYTQSLASQNSETQV